MGFPNATSNYQGYIEADVRNKIKNMNSKMFYLIHGTADNTVHIQHSMALSQHLVKNGILFHQQVNKITTFFLIRHFE